jgi:hypothetical protein
MKLNIADVMTLQKCCSKCGNVFDYPETFYCFKKEKELCFNCFKELVIAYNPSNSKGVNSSFPLEKSDGVINCNSENHNPAVNINQLKGGIKKNGSKRKSRINTRTKRARLQRGRYSQS